MKVRELEECTFRPALESKQRRVVQPDGPVVVRGLGRYLELRNMARQKAEEQAAQEERAFKVRSAPPPGGGTRPKPFRLSTARDPNRKERLQSEARQRELEQCTFRPQTNETASRAMIDNFLSDNSISTSTS